MKKGHKKSPKRFKPVGKGQHGQSATVAMMRELAGKK